MVPVALLVFIMALCNGRGPFGCNFFKNPARFTGLKYFCGWRRSSYLVKPIFAQPHPPDEYLLRHFPSPLFETQRSIFSNIALIVHEALH